MDPITRFNEVVGRDGIHAGLRFLNSRTPHRFTGVYRYDGDILRNVYLFDAFAPDQLTGQDVPMEDAYCAIVGQGRSSIEFSDIAQDRQIATKPGSPVVSYCGALITDDAGTPFGTLCHYDTKPCDVPASDMPVLEAIAPSIFVALTKTDSTL